MTTNDGNDGVRHFLTRYCKQSAPPYYAVLIDGPWGSGKTTLIDHFCAGLPGKPPLMVSLYGINSVQEISDRIFEKLHPILTSKPSKLVWNALRSGLKTTLKFDTGDTLQIGLPELEKWNESGAILVFDDLERANVPLTEVLGYINQYVEHDGCKVIIVANSSELKGDDGKLASAAKGKEKVIGRTLRIVPQADDAWFTFLGALKGDDAHTVLSGRKPIALAAFDSHGYQNLRHLRQAMLDFSDLWACLEGSRQLLMTNSDFLDRLTKDVLSLSMEFRSGHITPDDIRSIEDMDLVAPSYVETARADTIVKLRRIGLSDASMPAMLPRSYTRFFERGYLPPDEAINGVLRGPFFNDTQNIDWQRLWYHHQLSDEQFAALADRVLTRFQQGDYAEPGEFLHAAGLLISLAERGLLGEQSPADILDTGKQVIGTMAGAGKLPAKKGGGNYTFDTRSAFGLAFAARDTHQFHGLAAHLQSHLNSAQAAVMQSVAKAWMADLQVNARQWACRIRPDSGSDGHYAEYAIFADASPTEFAKIIHALEPPALVIVAQALRARYDALDAAQAWKARELPFWNFAVEFLKKIELREGTLSGAYVEDTLIPLAEEIQDELIKLEARTRQARK